MKTFLSISTIFITFFLHGQNFNYSDMTATSEKGYLGILNGRKLFYEVWEQRATNDLDYAVIILRTDTSDMSDSVDFNLNGLFEEDGLDSISVTITKHDSITEQDSAINFSIVDPTKIPTVFQILKTDYGCNQYYNFNKINSSNKIKLKNNKIKITYSHHCRFDESESNITETYQYENGKFILCKR